jgi:hypothetical protein
MKAYLALLGVVLFVTPAAAQLTPFEIQVGYGMSDSFRMNSGDRGRIEGLEVGVSQAFLKLPFVGELRIGISALLGGQLGGDDDGNVYRLFARYKTPSAGPNGMYGVVGVNFSRAEARRDAFDDFDRAGVDLGVGLPLGSPLPLLPNAALELIHHQSSKAQLRGWTLSVVVRI